jgi:hypothetical protein
MNPRWTVALLLISLSSLAWAQNPAQNYTRVSGIIIDASSASVPGAIVTVVSEDSGFRRVTVSEADGRYVVSPLQPGVYKITVRRAGFRTMIRFGVKLGVSQPARVDFKLVVGSVQETITVEGSSTPLGAPVDAAGTLIARDEIDRLPFSGRGALSLIELAPAVVVTPATRGEAGQFTSAGQRPNTNQFTVDGVSANSAVSGGGLPAQSTGAALPGMTAFGSYDSLVSREALEEVRVQTSAAGPAFGRLPGAQISLHSRAGSNELHGSLFYGFRNEKLDANDWIANQHGDPRAPLRLNNFAATLGGPLLRNRSFFFLSYEGMRLSQPLIWRQPAPSAAARENAPAWAQPMLNLFPTPNGDALGGGLAEWTGRYSRPSRLDIGSARLDQAITSRLTLFGRYSQSPSATQFGSGQVNLLDLTSRGLTTGLDLHARPDLVFVLRINASTTTANSVWIADACYQFVPSAPCNYLARLSIAGAGQVISGSEGRRSQSQFELKQTTQFHRGAHSLQLGADYVRLTPERLDASGAISVMAETVADLANANYWTSNLSPVHHASTVLREFSVFAQDTWRLTPRLMATYGLRWEIHPAPMPDTTANFQDPLTGFVLDLQRPLWRSTYGNLAPRVGLAYRATDAGRTVIRVGAGFYFDSSLSLATDVLNDGPLNVSTFISPRTAPFNTVLRFGFPLDLHLPLIRQWNASIEQGLGSRDVLSIGYTGSSGRNLIRREIGGVGSVPTDWLALATNHGSSQYHGFEAQYRRRLARGFSALASYTWSHSIDNSSTDSGFHWAGSGLTTGQDRGSSDFDIRHSLTAGFTYEIPRRGWAVDGIFRARTGFPITILNTEQFTGIRFENVFRPSIVLGQPTWITDPSAPAGKRINSAAFQTVPGSAQGDLGRNAISGFGMTQFDLALRRDFSLGEHRTIQLRIEAYNATNHPNFADPVRFRSSPLFGQSNSMLNLMLGTGSPGSGLAPVFQSGGARSLQVVMRFRF